MSPCFPLFNHYFYKKLSLYIQIQNIYLELGFEFGPQRIRDLASCVGSPCFNPYLTKELQNMEIKQNYQLLRFCFTNLKKYVLYSGGPLLSFKRRFSESKINFELLIALQLHIVCSSIQVGVQVFPYI